MTLVALKKTCKYELVNLGLGPDVERCAAKTGVSRKWRQQENKDGIVVFSLVILNMRGLGS